MTRTRAAASDSLSLRRPRPRLSHSARRDSVPVRPVAKAPAHREAAVCGPGPPPGPAYRRAAAATAAAGPRRGRGHGPRLAVLNDHGSDRNLSVTWSAPAVGCDSDIRVH